MVIIRIYTGIGASLVVQDTCKVDNRASPSATINQHKKKKKKNSKSCIKMAYAAAYNYKKTSAIMVTGD
jgi:hypothetical protein